MALMHVTGSKSRLQVNEGSFRDLLLTLLLTNLLLTLLLYYLQVNEGSFRDSEIVVMLGENGTGKTTFIKMLAGKRLKSLHIVGPYSYSRSNLPQ